MSADSSPSPHHGVDASALDPEDALYLCAGMMLWGMCRHAHGTFKARLPNMQHGRSAMGDIQHACQLAFWWARALRRDAAWTSGARGLWTTLQSDTSAPAWLNLVHAFHALRLSAFPLLRALCSVLEQVSATDGTVDSSDEEDEDDATRWIPTTMQVAQTILRHVSHSAMVSAARRVAQTLILGRTRRARHEWPTLMQPDGRIDLDAEDAVHWTAAMQHAMRVKLRPSPVWRAVGEQMLCILTDVLMPTPRELCERIAAGGAASYLKRYRAATTRALATQRFDPLDWVAHAPTGGEVRPQDAARRLFEAKWREKGSAAKDAVTRDYDAMLARCQQLRQTVTHACEQACLTPVVTGQALEYDTWKEDVRATELTAELRARKGAFWHRPMEQEERAGMRMEEARKGITWSIPSSYRNSLQSSAHESAATVAAGQPQHGGVSMPDAPVPPTAGAAAAAATAAAAAAATAAAAAAAATAAAAAAAAASCDSTSSSSSHASQRAAAAVAVLPRATPSEEASPPASPVGTYSDSSDIDEEVRDNANRAAWSRVDLTDPCHQHRPPTKGTKRRARDATEAHSDTDSDCSESDASSRSDTESKSDRQPKGPPSSRDQQMCRMVALRARNRGKVSAADQASLQKQQLEAMRAGVYLPHGEGTSERVWLSRLCEQIHKRNETGPKRERASAEAPRAGTAEDESEAVERLANRLMDSRSGRLSYRDAYAQAKQSLGLF
jgi:hypothetical protein